MDWYRFFATIGITLTMCVVTLFLVFFHDFLNRRSEHLGDVIYLGVIIIIFPTLIYILLGG